jgi:hypothetical protein
MDDQSQNVFRPKNLFIKRCLKCLTKIGVVDWGNPLNLLYGKFLINSANWKNHVKPLSLLLAYLPLRAKARNRSLESTSSS